MNPLALIKATSIALCLSGAAKATELPQPTGEIILTISGDIARRNSGEAAVFDRMMLESMGYVDVVTTTPWHDGETTFSGVPLLQLLEYVGASGETIIAVALNDYEVEIPVSDVIETGVIAATKMNGNDMSVKEKGPIFIIYPYDSSDALQSQTYYTRSAWQVAELIIR
ncbi:molybdopterin-dependent oxidoreductase [Paracoccus tibetensis]|uniref:molybdopterin-dependent oxidoreductase n=1 Tax=Paracoccus tibetensis TaxID=336292 RepID=UPI001113CAF0|nr:molybdopterin-dependent oxidoreductase [Paracoccus tibetensis]